MGQFEKLKISLRYYLQGAADQNKDFLLVLDAFEFALSYHTGVRKDEVTPEFMHQLETVLFLRTLLSGLKYPAETLAVMILHDVVEDYDVPVEFIRERFGERVAHAVWRIMFNRSPRIIVLGLFCLNGVRTPIGIGAVPFGTDPPTPPGMRVRTRRLEWINHTTSALELRAARSADHIPHCASRMDFIPAGVHASPIEMGI